MKGFITVTEMDITLTRIATKKTDGQCYVHARGAVRDDGFAVITMQKLDVTGCDVFDGIELIKSYDNGVTFTEPMLCKGLKRRYYPDGSSLVMSDGTPFFHKKTGKLILTGHLVWYNSENKLLGRRRRPVYAVYDEVEGDFGEYKELLLPDDNEYYSSGAGCSQTVELPSGDILLPITYKSINTVKNTKPSCASIVTAVCGFDGEELSLKTLGKAMTTTVPRGFCEPSAVWCNGKYYLAIRNDLDGYVAVSDNGLEYTAPTPLVFDDGESLGNYNTQQHWLVFGEKLYLVYTRRAGNNDHVFRHRAPLFIAEFDTERMCVKRSTERIAVPERGARLGNFGCQSYSENEGFIFASEWMQGKNGMEGCMRYGSDNSIFIAKIKH